MKKFLKRKPFFSKCLTSSALFLFTLITLFQPSRAASLVYVPQSAVVIQDMDGTVLYTERQIGAISSSDVDDIVNRMNGSTVILDLEGNVLYSGPIPKTQGELIEIFEKSM